MALDILKGLTGTPEGIDKLKSKSGTVLSNLLRLIVGNDDDTSKLALTCLVNLAQDPDTAAKLGSLNIVGRVMDYIREKTCPHFGLLVMLLANVTAIQAGSEQMLQVRGCRRSFP